AATFINSGTWDTQSDVTISNVLGGATSSFNNSGTFKKTASTGTTTIGLPFTNSGTVSVQTGTLYPSGGGGPSSGAFTTLTGASLIFGNGHSLSGPLSGGTIEFNSGTSTVSGTFSAAAAIFSGGTKTLSNNYNVSTSTAVNGGAAILTGSLVSLGTFTISTGSMNFSNTEGTVSLPSLTLGLGGAITGTSAVTIANLTWTGGGFSGTGALTTPAGGTVSISGVNLKDFQQRTFTMAGTLTWTGTGNIRTGAAATFINSGTWDTQSDVTISNVLGGATS